MRKQKIRGHKRRQKQLENWRLKNLEFRLDLLGHYKRDHIDILVHPWCDISIVNSSFPQPKGKTKQLMINALLDIYESWKKKLDSAGIQYYLKIWLYEERFQKSQVVCAIDGQKDFYLNTFSKPTINKEFDPLKFGSNKRLADFNWELRVDEEFYGNNTVGEPEQYENIQGYNESKKWFEGLMKKPHNIYKLEKPIDDYYEFYGFEKGKVWLGEKK